MTDPKSLSRERFARGAHEYVTSATHAGGEDLLAVVRLANAQPEWVALDVATGGGHTALALAPFVAGMVALDLTPEMLDAARAFADENGIAGIEFVLGDAEALPFPDASFDLVTCRIAAHHFPDVQLFANEAVRVLRPGGRLVLQDQCVPDSTAAAAFVNVFERFRDPSHVRSLTVDAWCEVLRRAGLQVESVECFEKRMNFERWCAMQSCPPETVVRLRELIADAGPSAAAWMDVTGEGADTTFTIHQCVMAASKA